MGGGGGGVSIGGCINKTWVPGILLSVRYYCTGIKIPPVVVR